MSEGEKRSCDGDHEIGFSVDRFFQEASEMQKSDNAEKSVFHFVYADVVEILFVVTFAADTPVLFLLRFQR